MDKTLQRRAGGYKILDGCKKYPNFKSKQRRPWIEATRVFMVKQLMLGDMDTFMLVRAAYQELGTLEARPMSNRGGTPMQRAQAIIGNIAAQGRKPILSTDTGRRRMRYTALSILIAALATDIMYRHWSGTPLRSPYFRSVQVGKAIHYLLRADIKTYEHDNGHGEIRQEVVRLKLGLTSRNVCQRLHQLTEALYGDFMEKHGHEIASKVLNPRPRVRRWRV